LPRLRRPAAHRHHPHPLRPQRAYRARHAPDPATPPAPLPAARSRTATGIYECPGCAERLAGARRCPDCNLYARRIGTGGECPARGDTITITELLEAAAAVFLLSDHASWLTGVTLDGLRAARARGRTADRNPNSGPARSNSPGRCATNATTRQMPPHRATDRRRIGRHPPHHLRPPLQGDSHDRGRRQLTRPHHAHARPTEP